MAGRCQRISRRHRGGDLIQLVRSRVLGLCSLRSPAEFRLTYFRHAKDAHTRTRVLDGVGESGNHLVDGDKAETLRAFAGCRNALEYPINRHEEPRPLPPWTQDVPRAKNGGGQSAGAQKLLAFRPSSDIRLHDGRGLRNAYINEMRDPCV